MKCSCGQKLQASWQLCPACGKEIVSNNSNIEKAGNEGRKTKKKIIIAMGIAMIISMFVYISSNNTLVKQSAQQSSPVLIATVLGQYASKIAIGLPFQIQKEKIDIPEPLRPLITNMERYGGTESSLNIDIVYCLYNAKALPADWSLDLEEAVNKVQSEISSVPSLSSLASSKKTISISGKPALLSTITFLDPRKVMVESTTLYIADDYSFWQVEILYSKNDENTRLAQQILQSVLLHRHWGEDLEERSSKLTTKPYQLLTFY